MLDFILGMMHTNRIDWRNNPKKSSVIPVPDKLASVPIVYAYPGAEESLLDGFIGKHEGVVIVSYGRFHLFFLDEACS
jgi:L-asparaginase/Glu-tRNA(Gln) amidotransferase subunit D